MASRLDPESLAVEAVLRIDELVKEKGGKGKCEALQRRAAELPQLIAQAGLLAATLFYMSKSDTNLYTGVYNWVKSGGEAPSVREECRGEGKGYTLSLILLSYALEKMAEKNLLGRASNECRSLSSIQELARCLKSLRDNGVEVRAERLLDPYLLAVKRLTEAFYKEKKER